MNDTQWLHLLLIGMVLLGWISDQLRAWTINRRLALLEERLAGSEYLICELDDDLEAIEASLEDAEEDDEDDWMGDPDAWRNGQSSG